MFCCKISFFKFNFWKLSFLGLLKHYKNWSFTDFCFVVEREEKAPKNDNWNFWIWFSDPKMAVS